jgi:hypothetical protein
MTIMFAGGITVAGSSFAFAPYMPEAMADHSNDAASSGTLSVSSTHVMGGAILGITVNDPSIGATDQQIAPPSVEYDGQSVDMTQMTDGTWQAYIVDHETVVGLDGDMENDNDSGFQYGVYCDSGLGAQGVSAGTGNYDSAGSLDSDITTNPSFYEGWHGGGAKGKGGGFGQSQYCQDTVDAGDGIGGGQVKFSVLLDAPTLNTNSGTGTNNSGNRNIMVNGTTGLSAWPFIQAINFSSTADIDYGAESVTVEWGNDHDTSISVDRDIIPDNAEIHLTIVDPGLNYDPTNEDVWIMDAAQETLYFYNNGSIGEKNTAQLPTQGASSAATGGEISIDGTNNSVIDAVTLGNLGCGDNCLLSVGGSPKNVISTNSSKSHFGFANITLTETGDNTGVFTTFDEETGVSSLKSATDAGVDSQMTFSYNGDSVTLVIGYNDATATFTAGDAWLPVEDAVYTITDPDMNKNALDDETLDIGDPHDRVPTIITGSPIHVSDRVSTTAREHSVGQQSLAHSSVAVSTGSSAANDVFYTTFASNTTDNSKRIKVVVNGIGGGAPTDASLNTVTWLNVTTDIAPSELVNLEGTVALQYDISGIAGALGSTDIDAYVMHETVGSTGSTPGKTMNGTASKTTNVISIVSSGNSASGIFDLNDATGDGAGAATIDSAATQKVGVNGVADSWGVASTNNAVAVVFQITHPAGNTLAANGTCAPGGAGHDKGCFGEYAIALDFVNWDQDNSSKTQNGVYRLEAEETGDNTGVFTGTVAYAILNNSTMITASGDPGGSSGFTRGGHGGNAEPEPGSAGGVPAPSPSFNGDELLVLLGKGQTGIDAPRVNINDSDTVGGTGTTLGVQLDANDHTGVAEFDLSSYGADDTATITITDLDLNQDNEQREVYTNSSGTFQIMIDDDDSQLLGDQVIIETSSNSGVFSGTFVVPNKLGKDMELQYYDSVDQSGEDSTTYDVASIASNLGTVALDRTSYPVPYLANNLDEGDNTVMSVAAGNVVGTITVTDPDATDDTFTTSTNANSCEAGKVKVKLSGTFVYTAAGSCATAATTTAAQELGVLTETAQGSGSYEIDFTIGGADCGGSNTGACQTAQTGVNAVPVNSTSILQVEYIDTADSAGATTTVYDSAIFELHTAQLSVDKDVYILGQDAVITLSDLDLNLDADEIEQYDLRLIEWDSDNNSSVLLHGSHCTSGCTLDPSNLTETGKNTGVFQTVFTIPTSMSDTGAAATSSEMGDEVILTYRDRGLSGEKSYGDDELDVEATFSISKFGAIVELDKAVYDWTDTVYITVTAPDWNQNSNSEETIGTSALPINANTRNGKLCSGTNSYTLNETDEDTGVFDGEIALTGFAHTMATSQSYTPAADSCSGNTDGTLQTAGNMDGITVSYEWVDNSIAIASAIIQWNIGEVEIVDSAVSPSGSTVIRVTDVDEDIDSTIVDTFKVDVFSDSDSGGFQATVSETGEDTGVFEAIIYFTDETATSGLTLRVSEGDTVTVEYTDVTLPGPDYTTADDITIAATTTVGTTTPPLERAPAANARVVDAFGSSVAEVSVDQQVQIAADVANAQSKEQSFAYLVQVQDANGVTVSLAWITGSLNAGQSMSPALSWTPSASGSYTATVFVWESVDNPVALSPTVTVGIDVV